MPCVEHATQVGAVHQHAGDVDEQIIEINRICIQHHLLIDRPDPLGDLVHWTPPAGLKRLRCRQLVLGPADHTSHPVNRGVGQ